MIAEHGNATRQRGVVLIFTLIILLILTIGAVALLGSMSNSLSTAGNLAYRRDLANQGEQAISTVLTAFKTGALVSSASTQANVQAANYAASTLATNTDGVPLALLNNATFASVGQTSNDITPAAYPDITLRYVIDRLCSSAGAPTGDMCVQSTASPSGGTNTSVAPVAAPTSTVYRLSVRVSGLRSTQVFLQATFTRAD
jgi:Tfp pilus assembly protein PilX